MVISENLFLYINIIIGVIFLVAAIRGYKNGFAWQIVSIAGIIATIVLAFLLSPPLAEIIKVWPKSWFYLQNEALNNFVYGKLNQIAWFFLLLVAGVIIMMIIKPLLEAVTDLPILKSANKLMGALLSVIPSFIITLLLCALMSSPFIANGDAVVEGTVLKYSKLVADSTMGFVAEGLDENSSITKMIFAPLTLSDDDVTNIVNWLTGEGITGEDIKVFLTNYGIDVDLINKLLAGE